MGGEGKNPQVGDDSLTWKFIRLFGYLPPPEKVIPYVAGTAFLGGISLGFMRSTRTSGGPQRLINDKNGLRGIKLGVKAFLYSTLICGTVGYLGTKLTMDAFGAKNVKELAEILNDKSPRVVTPNKIEDNTASTPAEKLDDGILDKSFWELKTPPKDRKI